MKIIFCGPPHSGKSVFIGGLKQLLPSAYLFRACPDGEGTWTYRTPDCAQYRRKGAFSKEIVEWYVKTLHNLTLSDIILVDVGGRITPENERIFAECDYAVILANDPNKFAEWEALCERTDVRVLEKIHSDYNAVADSAGVVHHLERGEDVSDRPTIKNLAAKIMDMAANNFNGVLDAKKSPKGMGEKNMITKVEISELANQLGKQSVEKTLPNGKTVTTIVWEGKDLLAISNLLHNEEKAEVVRINGAAPAWLVAAIAHECHPSVVEINSPDGYVGATCQEPAAIPAGNNLDWKVDDIGNGIVRVTVQQTDPSIPLSPADLAGWTPPTVPFDATLVLSGRMPNWGMTALALAYHGKAKACALFQPGVGATVCWTHSASVKLGSVIG